MGYFKQMDYTMKEMKKIEEDRKRYIWEDDEVFKQVPNSKYLISNYGKIISLKRGTNNPYLMSPRIGKNGYKAVSIYFNDGIMKTIEVHRLVFDTFSSCKFNKKGYRKIYHKNQHLTDNRYTNLKCIHPIDYINYYPSMFVNKEEEEETITYNPNRFFGK